jgi:hypothetical protein
MNRYIARWLALPAVAAFTLTVLSGPVLAAEYFGDNANKCNMCH